MLIRRNPTPGLLAASRTNGARSRGPVTAAGKAASAHAGLRHGLYSAAAVLPTESQPGFVALREGFLAGLRPRTPRESALVEQIVSALWCLQRARVAEFEIVNACVRELFPSACGDTNKASDYTIHHLSAAFSHLADSSGILDLIGRFESRHERRFYRALDNLCFARESAVVANRAWASVNLKMEVPPVIVLKTQPREQPAQPVTREAEPEKALAASAAAAAGSSRNVNQC